MKKAKLIKSNKKEIIQEDSTKTVEIEKILEKEINKSNWEKNFSISKKVIIFLSSFLITLLILISLAGTYLFKIRPEKTLEFNSSLFRNFENMKFLQFDSDYSGEVRLESGVPRIDETINPPTSTSSTKLTKVYRFTENNISEKLFPEGTEINEKDYGNTISKKDLGNSDILFLLFSDESIWNDILMNKKYSIEEFTRDNEKFWRFTINKDIANKLFMDNFKQSIIDGYNNGSTDKISSDSITAQFDGTVKITIDLNQKTKNLVNAVFSIDNNMFFNFNEKISADFGKLYAQTGEELKLKFILKKGYSQSSTVSKIEYQDEGLKFSKFKNFELYALRI